MPPSGAGWYFLALQRRRLVDEQRATEGREEFRNMSVFHDQRILNFSSLAGGIVGTVDFGEHFDGLIPSADLHQQAWTLNRGQNHQSKQSRRHHAGQKHPAPACRYVPRFIAHALNQHVDEDGGENANDDPQLIEGYAAAAKSRGSDLRNVVWRNDRRCADTDSANQTPDNKLVEIRGKEHAHGGKSETERAERKTFFLSQKVGRGSRARAADDASN